MKGAILLADPNSPAWDFAGKIKDYLHKSRSKDFPISSIDMTIFNNKEVMPYVAENIRKKDVYLVHSSNKYPNDWWVELLLLKDLCLSASVKSLNFVLPNINYSRQDRKTKSRVPISARALANSISPGLSRIITMDLHSPQIQGFYPANLPIDNLYSFPEVVKHIRKNNIGNLEDLVIVSPDTGGTDRAMAFLRRIINASESDKTKHNYSFAFTHKLRSKPGEIGKMFFVGDVKDKNVLVVDDIYDTGGTLENSGKILRENGAKKVFVYTTHGLFTKGTKGLFDKFDAVLTSNTHYVPKPEDGNIEVINMAPLFGETIYRAQRGLSVSELFD